MTVAASRETLRGTTRRKPIACANGRPLRSGAAVVLTILLSTVLPAGATQTCDLRTYAASTDRSRFEDHADGTIVDRRAKLMWSRCSAGQAWTAAHCVGDAAALDFRSAQALIRDVNRSGTLFFSDWRLPRAAELASIAERECSQPRIDLALFPDTPADFYWTATTRPQPAEGYAFALSFGSEGIRYLDKEQAVHLRLVRDAR